MVDLGEGVAASAASDAEGSPNCFSSTGLAISPAYAASAHNSGITSVKCHMPIEISVGIADNNPSWETVADTAPPIRDPHVNNTGTDQIYVKLTYPNYTLQFLFFSRDITLQAVSRFEAP